MAYVRGVRLVRPINGISLSDSVLSGDDGNYLKDIDGNNILDIDGNPIPVIT